MINSGFLPAVVVILLPLLLLFFPGIAIIRLVDFKDVLINGARAMLWSVGLAIVTSFTLAALGLPVAFAWVGVVVGSALFAIFRRKRIFCLSCGWTIMAVILPIVLLYAVLAVPYIVKHNGLPTGDSQKAIFWAQDVLTHNALPNYSLSFAHLNRDAGDFFTPGLHTVVAMLMSISAKPLITVGFFALVIGAGLAWITAAISKEVFTDNRHLIPPILAALFLITNTRFLRYFREPGYHLQNLIGEFLLFGLLLLGIRLLKKFNWPDFALASLLLISLVLSHQFSVFVGFFALLPIGILFFFTQATARLRTLLTAGIALLLILAIPFGFYEKVPHLFTADAHLSGLTPTLIGYPLTMGIMWFALGMGGLLVLITRAYQSRNVYQWAFVFATVAILVLSQGPRLFIDIPPVRALFYVVVPLSICAAYFVMHIRHFIENVANVWGRRAMLAVLAVVIVASTWTTAVRAYQTSSHAIAPNSTLTPDLEYASAALSAREGGAVLVDDYNRRAASWLILSGKPMFTRIAADISRQMSESKQSQVREDIYLNQLQYEKVFSLSSKPVAASIMNAQGISFLSAVEKRSVYGFLYNPSLVEIGRAGRSVLFGLDEVSEQIPNETTQWLLHASTLVNDIGDDEDTFQHLPGSIRTARLSAPQFDGQETFRTTTSPFIVLEFNAADYVDALWDQDGDGHIDTNLEFLVQTTFGPSSFELLTSSENSYTITSGSIVKVSPEDITITDKGAMQLILKNPTESLVGIDLIALGLSRTP